MMTVVVTVTVVVVPAYRVDPVCKRRNGGVGENKERSARRQKKRG